MNSFYTTSSFTAADGQLSCKLQYNAGHEIFSGHVPGNPIVPGVCTMAIVKELLEKAIGRSLMLREAKAVKFLGLINPFMTPILSISWKEENDEIVASASLADGTTSLFKMSGSYSQANP